MFNAPFDVQLSQFDVVQPDLAVFLSDHIGRISPSRERGAFTDRVAMANPADVAVDLSQVW